MTQSHSSRTAPFLVAGAVAAMALALLVTPARADQPTVIELTQTACQFVESENGIDHGFLSRQKSDCEGINDRTAAERLAKAEPLRLPAGRYVFRVTNENVPYDLGFWVRGDGVLARARLPSTSGGGLAEGTTKDYEIELAPGEYVYSCPLNPTPDYRLVVSG